MVAEKDSKYTQKVNVCLCLDQAVNHKSVRVFFSLNRCESDLFTEAHIGFRCGENPLSEVSAGAGKPSWIRRTVFRIFAKALKNKKLPEKYNASDLRKKNRS